MVYFVEMKKRDFDNQSRRRRFATSEEAADAEEEDELIDDDDGEPEEDEDAEVEGFNAAKGAPDPWLSQLREQVRRNSATNA